VVVVVVVTATAMVAVEVAAAMAAMVAVAAEAAEEEEEVADDGRAGSMVLPCEDRTTGLRPRALLVRERCRLKAWW
jgi:hypothetical protein